MALVPVEDPFTTLVPMWHLYIDVVVKLLLVCYLLDLTAVLTQTP